MVESDRLERLIEGLASSESRQRAAVEVGAAAGCDELLFLVRDAETRAFVPAPGMPKTIRGGPMWRRFLRECAEPGVREGEVDLPEPPLRRAWGFSTGESLVVAIGNAPDRDALQVLRLRMPLLGALLLCEQARRQQEVEVQLAREGAARAHALALALDTARAAAAELNGKLREETDRKDEFLAMLAHELRNPLAPLMSSVELLRRLDSSAAPALRRPLDVMSRQLAQLKRLVDDLLDVSRVSRGTITLEREVLSLGDVLQSAAETVAPLVDAKHHRLEVRGAEAGVHVVGDRARLIQVFANLLGNAAKYTEPGGSIAVDIIADGGRASVAVRDTGVGVPPDKLGAIFQMFSQLQSSLHRSDGGLGIGLTLARTLVDLHGGSITAHSAGLGRGSTFVVSLPQARPTAGHTQAAAMAPETGAELRGLRVLIVEDNVDGATTMADLLRHMNAEVRVAASGEEALGIVQGFAPQLVLLDIGLPGASGYEVASRLRSILGSRTRLVALTGYGSAEDKARALDAGFDQHLVKPATIDALQRLVADCSSSR
jgi:signal transduction histidine kinase/CheY-like chemotaxis protein